MLYSLAVNPELLNKDHFINQLDLTTNIGRSDDKTVDAYFALPPPQNISHYSTDTDYYLVNCGIIWAIRENEAFATPTNKKLLFSSNHFEAFPPYMYEQFDSLQKSLLTKKELRLEVYKNKP